MALVWRALGVKTPGSFSKNMQQMHHFSASGTLLCECYLRPQRVSLQALRVWYSQRAPRHVWYLLLLKWGGVSGVFPPSRCSCAAAQVLVVGCGNSELSEQMYDVGMCEDIVNIDISDAVIHQMRERSADTRPRMSYLLMDMLHMDFPDGHFQVVLDKGTLDALLTDEEEATLAKVDQMFAEISRVLQVGGRYLCVSLAQGHVLKKAVEYFSQEGWVVRVHQVASSGDKEQFVLPVFVYVMTKFRKIPGSAAQILEICPEEQDKPMRVESAEQLVAAVKDRQHYALLCSQISKTPCREQVSLDLCDKESGKPRYTLHVVDSPSVKPSRDNHFAIFISEYSLSSCSQVVALARSCKTASPSGPVEFGAEEGNKPPVWGWADALIQLHGGICACLVVQAEIWHRVCWAEGHCLPHLQGGNSCLDAGVSQVSTLQ